MKEKYLKILIIGSLILGVSMSKSVTIKAMTIDELYSKTYDTTVKAEQIMQDCSRNHHYDSDYDEGFRSNEFANLIDAVKDKDLQNVILQGRQYLNQFPKSYWKAKNTFSERLDKVQQPVYTEIVCGIEELMNSSGGNSYYDDTEMALLNREQQIQDRIGDLRVLNKNVPLEYGRAYSVAIDGVQQRVINFVCDLIEKAKESKDLNDTAKAQIALNTFKEGIDKSGNLYSFAIELQQKLDKIKDEVPNPKFITESPFTINKNAECNIETDYNKITVPGDVSTVLNDIATAYVTNGVSKEYLERTLNGSIVCAHYKIVNIHISSTTVPEKMWYNSVGLKDIMVSKGLTSYVPKSNLVWDCYLKALKIDLAQKYAGSKYARVTFELEKIN